jgi:hypothetical protein
MDTRPYVSKVPYRWLIGIDTLLLRLRNLLPFVDPVEDRTADTENQTKQSRHRFI